MVVPDDVDQLVAPHRPVAIEREVGEQEPPLAARQGLLDPAPVDLDGQGAAQLDTGGHGLPPTVQPGVATDQDTPNAFAAASSRSSAAR